jgi:uroporphyrinogen-III synthase
VVGARTAESARKAGFFSVSEGPGDAAALADMIAIELGKATLAYLCGRVRMPEFERRLGVNGMRVVPIETYDTVALNPAPSFVRQQLGGQPIDAVLVYSARAAAAFGSLMQMQAEADFLMREATCFCLSGRIAASMVDGLRVEVAPDPNEDALLALLGDPD